MFEMRFENAVRVWYRFPEFERGADLKKVELVYFDATGQEVGYTSDVDCRGMDLATLIATLEHANGKWRQVVKTKEPPTPST